MFNPCPSLCGLLALLGSVVGDRAFRSVAPSWCACSGIPIPRKRCSRSSFHQQQTPVMRTRAHYQKKLEMAGQRNGLRGLARRAQHDVSGIPKGQILRSPVRHLHARCQVLSEANPASGSSVPPKDRFVALNLEDPSAESIRGGHAARIEGARLWSTQARAKAARARTAMSPEVPGLSVIHATRRENPVDRP